MSGAAAGLGAFGFRIFIAAVVVAGIWYDARKRESQQETLRRVVESGQTLDKAIIDRVLSASGKGDRVDRDYKIAGIIVISVAPGIAILGWFLGRMDQTILPIMTGVALLVAFVGAGLLFVAHMTKRWYQEDSGSSY